MSQKRPAFMFYPGDWLKDPALSMCTPTTRGVWVDLLCILHELGSTGQVTGTPDQLARACRCGVPDFVEAITDLSKTGAADIYEREGNVTVICRRMQREHKERLATANRVRKFRCNANVTHPETEMKHESNGASSYSYSREYSTGDKSPVEDEDPPPKPVSSANKTKPAAKREKVTSDPRSSHPAIQTCRRMASRYPPKEIWNELIELLGESPDEPKLLECRKEWAKRGYNLLNWNWVCAWYKHGIPDRTGGGGNITKEAANGRISDNRANTATAGQSNRGEMGFDAKTVI